MQTQTSLLIYGAGGSGRETAWLAQCCQEAHGGPLPVAFVDDSANLEASPIHGLPVLPLHVAAARFPGAYFTTAVGSPAVREALTAKARSAGLIDHSLIHASVFRSKHIEMGKGVVICAGTTLTTDIRIGDGVQININCSISHDCILNEYVTLAPGAHLCGNVHVGRGAYIGAGAVVKNGKPSDPIVIGEGAVVGAGACVTRSVDPFLTVVGVPAVPLRKQVAHAS